MSRSKWKRPLRFQGETNFLLIEDTSDPSSGNQSSHPNSGTGESGKTQQTFVRNATEAKTFVRDQRETAASPQSLVREAADTRTMVRPTGDRKQSVPAPAHRNRPMRTGSLQYIVEKHSKETHSSGANSASSGTDNRTGLASAPSNWEAHWYESPVDAMILFVRILHFFHA